MATRTPKEIEQQIVELYNNGIGTNEIALRFDICRATVRSILKRNDIAVRKNLPWKNKYNIHFFDTFTPASCYWAGFIAADGNIHSNRDVIYNNGIKVRKTKNNNTEKSLIQNITINYFCENALNILKLLYNESNENIYLDRKYKKFLEFYKRNN